MIDDEKDYLSIRYKLQQQPSANQMKTTKNAQKVRFDTGNQNTEQFPTPNVTTVDPNRKEKFQKTLIVHCRHERRLEALKRDMHRIYDSVFRGTPAMDIKLIVGHTNNRSVKRDLAQARPTMILLNPMKTPSECRILFRGIEVDTVTKRLSLFNLEPRTNDSKRCKRYKNEQRLPSKPPKHRQDHHPMPTTRI